MYHLILYELGQTQVIDRCIFAVRVIRDKKYKKTYKLRWWKNGSKGVAVADEAFFS